ncbi:MAG: phosphoribosylglycinamide formyltransferase [Proteobacteria bacterium]|nr:phosphoribosylglycinamide formyltransferase [Pseudomonadota bacterium]
MGNRGDRPLSIAVLASGSGTNLQSIIDSCESGRIPARVTAVISDVPEAHALNRAARHGISAHAVKRGDFASKREFEERIVELLREHGAELVCLAGYMRIVGSTVLDAYPMRVMNIHPALLPSFPGLEGQRQALEYGVKVAGCTVHFVDALADHGPIIAQRAVEVHEGDTVDSLRERILAEEHRLYPLAIRLFAEGRLTVEGRIVIIRE